MQAIILVYSKFGSNQCGRTLRGYFNFLFAFYAFLLSNSKGIQIQTYAFISMVFAFLGTPTL
jgi:hypothetical protein